MRKTRVFAFSSLIYIDLRLSFSTRQQEIWLRPHNMKGQLDISRERQEVAAVSPDTGPFRRCERHPSMKRKMEPVRCQLFGEEESFCLTQYDRYDKMDLFNNKIS